ncbi:MAG: hypothetical protein JO270_11735, partial [Acidobacteriaceae bacterium]|nr:hypothetical protein [Acidobacteriaceae bacterium]
ISPSRVLALRDSLRDSLLVKGVHDDLGPDASALPGVRAELADMGMPQFTTAKLRMLVSRKLVDEVDPQRVMTLEFRARMIALAVLRRYRAGSDSARISPSLNPAPVCNVRHSGCVLADGSG